MSHVSTLDLHRLRYGELPATRAAGLRQHLDDCAACRGRMQAQQALRAEFEVLPVPAGLRTPPARPWWTWSRLPALAAMAAALMLTLRLADPSATDTTRLKGAAAEVLVEGRGTLASGDLVRAGDRLQVRVPAGPWAEAWVSDGATVLGRFPLVEGEATLAPFSLTIDDSPGRERLVIVLSEGPGTEAQVKRALRGESVPGLKKVELSFVKGE